MNDPRAEGRASPSKHARAESTTALLSPELVEALMEHAERLRLRRGEFLIRKGDDAETLYFITRGRFVVSHSGRIIAELGPGEPIGETAFLAKGVRTADVHALRDSEVLVIDRQAYDTFLNERTDMTAALLRALSGRLADATRWVPMLQGQAPRMVAVLGLTSGPKPRALTETLSEEMFGRPAESALDLAQERSETDLVQLVHQIEAGGGGVFFVDATVQDAADGQGTVMAQCDRIVIAVDPDCADPATLTLPSELDETLCHFRPRDRHLALLRSADRPISGSAAWLARFDVRYHHQISCGSRNDVARLSRFLQDKALGLVMAGGGAAGFIHVGVVRALNEAGIFPDIFGGTSAGSVMAMAMAAGRTCEEAMASGEEIFVKSGSLNRWTVPIISLRDHRPYDMALKTHFPGMIEDLPHLAFAFSTNLSSHSGHVHRRGAVWESVRASTSIPGFLPPFITDEGEALVDGALVDNLPLATMRDIKDGPNVVVALTGYQSYRAGMEYADLPGRRDLVYHMIRSLGANPSWPRMFDVLQQAMMVSSRNRLRSIDLDNVLLIRPRSAPNAGFFEWKAARAQEKAGYEHMKGLLERHGGFEALFKAGGDSL